MATTYTLISSNVLTSSTASVTFSSIPSTYTDLVLKTSTRSDRAAVNDAIKLILNGDTATNYSYTYLRVNSGTVASAASASDVQINLYYTDAATSTATTFANTELYIPSYTASQNKPISNFSVEEENATNAAMATTAGLWRNTAAITSIALTPAFGTNWVSGSSFYLYGIKNS